MVKLKDIFNIKTNKRNHQISLDAKKRVLKKLDLDIDDIMDIKILKKKKRWQI